jgi:glycerol transport system permease protein
LVALLFSAGLRSILTLTTGRTHRRSQQIRSVSSFQLPKMRGVLMIAVLLRFMDSFMICTPGLCVDRRRSGNSTTVLVIAVHLAKAVGQFDLGPAAAFFH